MIGTVASIMAATIINVAVPDMSRVFALGHERAQWLSAGFMGAMTLSMLTTPWLLVRYGYRHAYSGAVVVLMAGGIVGGFSPWFDPRPRGARRRGAGRRRAAADPGDRRPARVRRR